MDDSLAEQVLVSLYNLGDNFDCVSFCESLLLSYVLVKVAVRAVFHNQVVVLSCLDNLQQFYDVFVVEAPVNLNLVLQHVQVAAFEFFQVNCLDSYSFVGFANLDAFVDLTAEALA